MKISYLIAEIHDYSRKAHFLHQAFFLPVTTILFFLRLDTALNPSFGVKLKKEGGTHLFVSTQQATYSLTKLSHLWLRFKLIDPKVDPINDRSKVYFVSVASLALERSSRNAELTDMSKTSYVSPPCKRDEL